MRILQFVHGYPPELAGGTERYVEALAAGLRGRGHEVVVVAGAKTGRPELAVEESRVEGLRLLRLFRDDTWHERWDRTPHAGASEAIHDIFRRERPDVAHVHHWLRLTRDLVARGSEAGVPVVLTLHDFFATCPLVFRVRPDTSFCRAPAASDPCVDCVRWMPDLAVAGVERLLRSFRDGLERELAAAARVLVLSEAQRRVLVEVLGGRAPGFEVVPFRPLRRLRRAPRPAPPPPLRVVNWGNQSRFKGQQLLLEALSRMRHRDAVQVHLYGGHDLPEFDEELERRAAGLPVTRHGPFAYEVLEKTGFHLAVFPSYCHETYGFVLDEAQMLGLPALVPDLGAYAERLAGGGETFPRGDAAALAARLDAFVEDPARLAGLRRRVPVPADFAEHVDAIEDVYERALRSRE